MTDQSANSVNEPNSDGSLVNSDAVKKIPKIPSRLLALYKPKLQRIKKQVLDFMRRQENLLVEMESENKNFRHSMDTTELHAMMANVKSYHEKLNTIRKEMGFIHGRSNRIKKRALRLKQAKEREALARKQQRKERLLHKQSLIAQPAHRSTAAASAPAIPDSPDSPDSQYSPYYPASPIPPEFLESPASPDPLESPASPDPLESPASPGP